MNGSGASVLHGVALHAQARRLPRPGEFEAKTDVSAVSTPSVAIKNVVSAANTDGNWAQRLQQAYEQGQRDAQAQAAQAARQHAAAWAEQQLAAEVAKQVAAIRAEARAEALSAQMAEHVAQQVAQQVAAQAQANRQTALEQADLHLRQRLQQVHAEAQAQHADEHQRLQALLQNLPQQLLDYLADAEDDMLALVFEVVTRILGDEAANLPGLRAQLQMRLKAWHGRELLSLHLHPDDLELLQHDEASLRSLRAAGFASERGTLRWVADPKVQLGGCMLRSAEGALDARLEVQLQALRQTLLATRAARRAAAAAETPTHVPGPTAGTDTAVGA